MAWTASQETVTAAPVALPAHPRFNNEGSSYAFSSEGTLAYLLGSAARYAQRVVWVDHAGSVEALPLPLRDYEAVALSPDGRQAVRRSVKSWLGLQDQ